MAKLTKAGAKKKLDAIAALINELHADAERSFGNGAYIYFEAEGSAHLMLPESDNDASATASERQEKIIVSSARCAFDCGAW